MSSLSRERVGPRGGPGLVLGLVPVPILTLTNVIYYIFGKKIGHNEKEGFLNTELKFISFMDGP